MVQLIIAVVILFFVGKHILLNVKINSSLFIIAGIAAIILKWQPIPISLFSAILLSLNFIDCLRDLIIADDFYKNISDGVDKHFAVKSLTTAALLLLGIFGNSFFLITALIPRVIFLCIVNPYTFLKVLEDVLEKVEYGYPLPYSKWRYSDSTRECYYYQKIVKRLFNKGRLVSNYKTVIEERDESQKKLSDKYPKNLIERVANFIKNDKEAKAEIANAEKKLSDTATYRRTAYVNSEFFEQYGKRIAEVLKDKKSALSPWKIKTLRELKDLNLTAQNGYYEDTEWSEYFIIQSLKQLVQAGTIMDFKCSDEPLNNHAYGVAMFSRDASNDPRLALDD